VTGNGTGTVTVTGSRGDHAALEGLTYAPTADYNGRRRLGVQHQRRRPDRQRQAWRSRSTPVAEHHQRYGRHAGRRGGHLQRDHRHQRRHRRHFENPGPDSAVNGTAIAIGQTVNVADGTVP